MFPHATFSGQFAPDIHSVQSKGLALPCAASTAVPLVGVMKSLTGVTHACSQQPFS